MGWRRQSAILTSKIVVVKWSALAPIRREVEEVLSAFREQGVRLPHQAELLVIGSSDLSARPDGALIGRDLNIAASALIANFPEFEPYFPIADGSFRMKGGLDGKNLKLETYPVNTKAGHFKVFIIEVL
jgi:hypothetical protein